MVKESSFITFQNINNPNQKVYVNKKELLIFFKNNLKEITDEMKDLIDDIRTQFELRNYIDFQLTGERDYKKMLIKNLKGKIKRAEIAEIIYPDGTWPVYWDYKGDITINKKLKDEVFTID